MHSVAIVTGLRQVQHLRSRAPNNLSGRLAAASPSPLFRRTALPCWGRAAAAGAAPESNSWHAMTWDDRNAAPVSSAHLVSASTSRAARYKSFMLQMLIIERNMTNQESAPRSPWRSVPRRTGWPRTPPGCRLCSEGPGKGAAGMISRGMLCGKASLQSAVDSLGCWWEELHRKLQLHPCLPFP